MANDDVRVWEASDAWVASMVRHLTGKPHYVSVSRAEIARWRRMAIVEASRVGQARRLKRDPYTNLPRVYPGPEAIVVDLLRSPEGRLLIEILLTMPAMLDGLAAGSAALWSEVFSERARERKAERAAVEAVRKYLSSKLGGPAYSPPPAGPPSAAHRAGCNAVTVSKARDWLTRISDSHSRFQRGDVLDEIAEVGRAASPAYPGIWYPDAGPPRGLWPDPPVSAVTLTDETRERPAFIQGISR